MADLRQRLKAQRTTLMNGNNFRLPFDTTRAAATLYAAYEAEVLARGRNELRDPEVIYSNILQVVQGLVNPKCNLILISGLYGNGKTTMLYAIQNLINYCTKSPSDKYYHIDKEYQLRIELAIDIATYAINTDNGKYDTVVNCYCLGIDDMGREPQEVLHYGNKVNPIADLLERRYAKQRLTIITTNAKKEEIRERYGERVYDRMREMGKIVVFQNSSFRGAPSQQQTNQN